jgi:hypothetical protein
VKQKSLPRVLAFFAMLFETDETLEIPRFAVVFDYSGTSFWGDAISTPLDEHFNRARRPSRVHFCCTAYVFRAFARFLFREMFSRSFLEHANNEAFFLFGKREEKRVHQSGKKKR